MAISSWSGTTTPASSPPMRMPAKSSSNAVIVVSARTGDRESRQDRRRRSAATPFRGAPRSDARRSERAISKRIEHLVDTTSLATKRFKRDRTRRCGPFFMSHRAGQSSARDRACTPSRPARSWMNCHATRPERAPRVSAPFQRIAFDCQQDRRIKSDSTAHSRLTIAEVLILRAVVEPKPKSKAIRKRNFFFHRLGCIDGG